MPKMANPSAEKPQNSGLSVGGRLFTPVFPLPSEPEKYKKKYRHLAAKNVAAEKKRQSSRELRAAEKPVTTVSCRAHRGQFSIGICVDGRRERYPITKDKAKAEMLTAHVADSLTGGAFSDVVTPAVRNILYRRLEFAKSRAYTRKLEYNLTVGWIVELYNRQQGRCAVSGLRLDIAKRERNVDGWKRPFGPSLDRIDSSRGYLQDNCRIVCSAVNNAMGSWGEGVLHLIARALTRQD